MKYVKSIICISSFYVLSQLLAIRGGQGGTYYLSAGWIEYLVAALLIICGLYLTHRLNGTRLLIVLKLLTIAVLAWAIGLAFYAIAGRMELLSNLNLLTVVASISVLLGTSLVLFYSAAVIAWEQLVERGE
ncbi:hypothetical protein [Pseudomonas sp. Irchel 3E13]|uniref:hypothetical protein n=1 Tax=Pseudomonas sp. Irchel 3E13 TaxID=2008975 RepID=UPI000BA35560|nr:hypothetical protein [Pseudomonas sp. Irchel 3E13]